MKRKLGAFETAQTLSGGYAPFNAASVFLLSNGPSAIDSTSVLRLARELLSLCGMNRIERQNADYEPLPLLPPEEDLFPWAFQGLVRTWKTILFMARQVGDEIRYRQKTRGRKMPPVHERACCRIFPAKLCEEDTQRIIRQCRTNRVSLASFCSAAMILAVSRLLYDNQGLPFRHVTFADLRPYLKPPVSDEHIGSYHSLMRMTVPVKENQDFWELARRINQIIYEAVKRGDKFISPLMSAKMMLMYIGS